MLVLVYAHCLLAAHCSLLTAHRSLATHRLFGFRSFDSQKRSVASSLRKNLILFKSGLSQPLVMQ